MAKKKKVVKQIKLQIEAGKANPAPPVGPALGAAGVNIMGFCKDFNSRTSNRSGDVLPVVISVHSDKSFTFIVKEQPIAYAIKKCLGLKAASGVPNRDKVGTLTRQQVREIAQAKIADMNTTDVEQAMHMVMGTARSMGVNVETVGVNVEAVEK